MKDEYYDYIYKIVVIGDSDVGKTNLISRYTLNEFSPENRATIGIEFCHALFQHSNGSLIKIQIWDTAGQERFRSMTHAYYRGTMGAIIVYDITKIGTFKSAARWLEELKKFVPDDIPIMLIGNKSDRSELREVSTDQAKEFARDHRLSFMETSALSGQNVQSACNSFIDTLHETNCSKLKVNCENLREISKGEKIVIKEKKARKSCC